MDSHKKKRPIFPYSVLLTLFAFAAVTDLSAQDSVSVAKRSRFLVLDNRIIESVENAELVVGTVEKHKSNPLFGEDKPWEKRFDNLYGNVIYDEDDKVYKCWYSPFTTDNSAKGMTLEQRGEKYRSPKGRKMSICYATSEDGITWKKPVLGMVEYNGDKQNNIVWRGPHGAGIFKDLRDPDPSRQYKTIFKGLKVSFSADGITWDKPIRCEGVNVRGDTHNNAFWAPTLGKYVGITRTWDKSKNGKRSKVRQVARIESDDFINWTTEEVVLEGVNKDLQTYSMPVFFHGGIYLGLVAIHEQSSDRVWTELAWSGDTKKWNRVSPGTPLIPCSNQKLEYDYGCVYACAYPVFLENEIRLYYGGSDWLHYGWRNGSLCLATMRPDGFAGYQQQTKDKPAVITTVAIPYDGQAIQITADVSKKGSVEVSVLNEDGETIATTEKVSKTVTDCPLKLSNKIMANSIRLKCEASRAKLYSFSFADRINR